ncbi:YheC/YheD family protein [Bacillus coahuilensis]|uniref:YheC/YheD family protein n=1 Tax=Bacillus coahuilensis TaxID=408580 RepID=UPI0002F3B2B1|nr:YheC/YheD family protein [Bacillus coahuilensis]
MIKQGSIPSIKLFLESLLSYRTFIMQRKIDNVTPLNEPFDIRLFLQKDSNGKWQQIARGIRVASKGALLTNLSSTGTLVKYEDFQLEHPQIDWRDIDEILDMFIHFLPNTLENYFAPLFELGVDVLIGTDGSVWICDINSKPGVKLAHFIQDKCQLSKAPLLYTLYLHQMLIQDIYRI